MQRGRALEDLGPPYPVSRQYLSNHRRVLKLSHNYQTTHEMYTSLPRAVWEFITAMNDRVQYVGADIWNRIIGINQLRYAVLEYHDLLKATFRFHNAPRARRPNENDHYLVYFQRIQRGVPYGQFMHNMWLEQAPQRSIIRRLRRAFNLRKSWVQSQMCDQLGFTL